MTLIPTIRNISFKAGVCGFALWVAVFFSGCAGKAKEGTANSTASSAISLDQGGAPLHAAKKTVEECRQAYEQIKSYTAIVEKEERLDGGELRPQETILVKFRKPNQIYMKWIREPNKGMELIYPVKENKLVVEPGGLADLITPRLYLNPTDRLARLQNRHPVTEADLGYFIRRYSEDFARALEKKEAQIAFENPAHLEGKPAHRLETLLPNSPESGYYCYRSVVYFDLETALPLQIEFYDWEDKLFERYRYTALQINPELTDKDFDENNPEYDF